MVSITSSSSIFIDKLVKFEKLDEYVDIDQALDTDQKLDDKYTFDTEPIVVSSPNSSLYYQLSSDIIDELSSTLIQELELIDKMSSDIMETQFDEILYKYVTDDIDFINYLKFTRVQFKLKGITKNRKVIFKFRR